MTKSVEASGKTIEQALQKALRELGVRPEEVDIEILSEGGGGLLGIFGARQVRIRVSVRDRRPPASNAQTICDILGEVLAFLGVEYTTTVEEMPDTTFVNITSNGLDGLLIGRRGETLASIQHVVNRIFTSRTGRHSKVTIDVGGYIRRRHRLLVEKARKMAERVRRTGRECEFEPLKAAERRIVHLAVADEDDVTSYTIGDGLLRRVVITPRGPVAPSHDETD